MKKIKVLSIIVLFCCASFFSGCLEEEKQDGNEIDEGTLLLKITDKPPDLDIIYANITISKVQVHKSVAGTNDTNGENNESENDFVVDAGGTYSGSIDEPIQFKGNASGGIEPFNWFWDFGDGYNETVQNPQHVYSEEGEYTVILIVTDANNVTAQDITIADIENESANEFIVDAGEDYKAEVNEIIQFYGTAEGGVEPYNWSWKFGDGNISFEQNPQHQYRNKGVYEVNLTVMDNISTLAWDITQAIIGEENDNENDNSEEGWYTVINEPQIFDLIKLQNVTDILGEKELTTGKYTQIRLTIEKAEITINNSGKNEVHNLKISSNTIKLIKAFWIYKNEITILTLDFNIYKSIHETGSGKYIMKPTIKVIQE